EIENHLLQFPGVRQASVVALGDRAGDKHLVAFLIGPASAPAAELRAFLLRRVPDYCVPSGFQTLEAFPLTPNGKIDRAALVERGSRLERSVCAIAPRDDVEEKLAQIWREVLQIDNLGVQDNFFELGGHSLRATQVMAKVREAFHLELSLRTLFENPTIEGLARALAEHAAEPACEPLPQIVPDSAHRYDPFPLTDVQAAYWIGRTDAFDLGNIGCHLYREIDSRDLDAARFERAFQRLVERHDMMRAIVLPDGTQRVLKHAGPYKIAVLDLRGEAPETLEARLTAIREEMSHHVLPAEKWPLFDIRLTRLPDGRTRLHFSIDLLIVDALSLRLLVHELHLLYTRPETILPALELTFRDYVLAEAALKNSEQHRAAEAYWDRRLPELPPAPDLPLARNPSAIAQPWFTRRSRSLSAEQWRKFRALSRQAGLTPSMVLLGAFAEVLGTWSKNQRFTLNLTLFNRLPMHQQVNSIIGDFTSLVPLAIDPEPASHFSARAKRIQEQLWEDLDHRAVSGIQVLRKLSRLHGARANLPVVFTSVVDLYETEQCSTPWDVLGERVYDIYQTPQVWLDSTVKEDAEGGLLVEWDVVEELFPEGLIDSMFEAYCEFILRLVDDPRVWHQSSPRLVPADQLALRERVNDTAAPISPALLHQGFLDQAARNPDAIAVIASKRRVTYGELSCAAGALAAKLSKHRSNEISTNTLVAIVMEKGWEQAAAALGVLQSGAAYVPIDPAAPPERLEHLLHHAGARVALTQPDVDARIAWPKDVRRIVVDDKLLSARPEGVHGAGPASPENLAYVIYTSGSTGLPKGVMIDHRGAWNTVVDINQRVEAGREDRVLALSALNFDLSVYDLFGLLAAGGAIVIPDPGSLRDPASWLRLIENEKITLWNTVPALMEMLVSYAETRSERLPDSLRAIMLSGDWIPVTLPARIRAQLPNARQISLGGATEASIWSVVYPIDEVQADWKSIPYGRPLANQTIHALNDHLLPCPVWVPGQLYIGGAGLALGYWRDEEKTQASFIRHPLTGERLYRTGDLGRYLPSGDVEFLGREDFQVKILGFRIELGEIEATLMQHPAIAEAIVTARSDGGSKRLVGYFTTRSGQSLDTDEVRNFLKSKLPEYMVPSALVALPKLPLSPNGKIDRKALPAPEAAGSRLARVEPRSPTEAALAGIWKEILGLSEIGVHDHFLEIGGNSLQAIQILSRVCRTFQIDLSLAALFQAPTIAETAEMVEEQILDQLEQMSDEDAERLLNSKPDLKEAGR
ncbi:MAG: amino acid adenylation domain-containing protein, partial [Verrucomicrobiae bacterium]|nr:amino acid adenylation domain-containing protein [Verrucomicrobiae bacterium]